LGLIRPVFFIRLHAEAARLHPYFVRLRFGDREDSAARFDERLMASAARGVVQPLADDAYDIHPRVLQHVPERGLAGPVMRLS